MQTEKRLKLPTPEEVTKRFTFVDTFTFQRDPNSKSNGVLAVVDGKEYKFPLPWATVFVSDFISARMRAVQTGGWETALVKNNGKERWYVDGKYGAILLSLRSSGVKIDAEGSIFNPKHGEEVILALKGILTNLAEEFQKPVRYKTFLVNKTQSLKDLLVRCGFELIEYGMDEGEYELVIYPKYDRQDKEG